jgi:hypothetical protein
MASHVSSPTEDDTRRMSKNSADPSRDDALKVSRPVVER